MLRKTLAKVFITNKFTQCKTSRILKIDVFKITDDKNIGKLFSKYELLLLDQVNSGSDPSNIDTTIPYAWSVPQSSLCSSLSGLFCPTPFNQTPPKVLDMPNHGKPS